MQVTDTDADGMICRTMLLLPADSIPAALQRKIRAKHRQTAKVQKVWSLFWGMSKTDELPLKLCYFTTFKHGETVKSGGLKKDSVF